MSQFQERLMVLFATWDALRLALEQDPEVYQVRHQALVEETASYFGISNVQIEATDMQDFFDAFFEDVFGVCVQDGTIEIYAQYSCSLYDEIQQGADAVWQKVQQFSAKRTADYRPKVQLVEYSSCSEDEEEVEDVVMQEASVKEKDLPDEDGWITVKRK